MDNLQTEKSFKKTLISIAIPIALQNLMLALVGSSDALMLGRLSQNAVSAVSLANQVSFIMTIFIGSIAGGVGTLVAQYYGKKDNDMVKRLMSIGIKLCGITSIIFFFITFFMPDILMKIYTNDTELIATGSEYLKIVSFSYLMSGVTQIYLMIMKITDRATMGAIISIMTVVIDMSVDFFLIYGFAGFPRMEVKGCAVSTVVVEACALLVCVIDSYVKEHFHPDKKSFFSFSKLLYKDLGKITAPMLLSYLAWGVGYSLHSVIMGRQGKDAIAAFAIIAVIQELVVCLCKGLSSASSIMIGQVLGQNLMDKAKGLGAKFCKVAIWCGVFNAVMLLIAGPIASRFFILTNEARSYFIKMMFVLAVYLFAYSLNTIIVCGIFPAGGDTAYDAKTVFVSMWCVSLPLALLGSYVFHFSPMIVFILVMCDEVIKIPWIFPRYKKYIWLKNLTRDENTVR